jgi:hypothetical protein
LPPTATSVDVFEREASLLAGLDPRAVDDLRARGRVEGLSFEPGIVELPQVADGTLVLLVLDGFLTRESTTVGRTSVELLGPGDLVRPWDDNRAEAPVPVESRYRALETTSLAVIGPRFVASVRPWPQVVDSLCARLTERLRWFAMQAALIQLTRIEDRVLVLLWHLADRWGQVERDGSVLVSLRLTHKLLAGMVGSQRPTVTTALTRLAARGRVSRRDDGWLLHGAPPTSGLLEGQALADAFRLRDD